MGNNEKVLNDINAHFKQWQGIAEQVKWQVSPVLMQQDLLQKSMQPIIEAQKTIETTLGPILEQQAHYEMIAKSVQIPRYDPPDFSYITKQAIEIANQAAGFQNLFKGLVNPAFEQFQRSFRELPPRIQKALLLLGSHGWYMDEEWTIPDLFQLTKALSDGNIEEAEHALIEHFESRIDEIEKSLLKRFPHREKLIKAAFKAHRRQEYELAIPVLLAQTDGICKELVNEFLFIKQNKKPRTAKYVEQIVSDALEAAFLSPLSQTLPIGASEHERPEGFNELNRHMVMHGESLDYGNKSNSLKAISLINYVSYELTPEKKN